MALRVIVALAILLIGVSYCNELHGFEFQEDPALYRTNCPYHVAIGAAHLSGHLTPVLGIAQELAKRGCRVSFPIAPLKLKVVQAITPVIGYDGQEHHIDVFPMEVKTQQINPDIRKDFTKSRWRMFLNIGKILNQFLDLTADYYEPLVEKWSQPGERPDVLIAMGTAIGQISAADKLNIPVIYTQPGLLMRQAYPYHHVPHMSPFFQISKSDIETSWLKRILNSVVVEFGSHIMLKVMYMSMSKWRETRGLPPMERAQNGDNGKLTLQQTSFALEYAQPIAPNLHLIGPVFPDKDEELSPELKKWLDETTTEQGVIYVCMGTQVILNEEIAEVMSKSLIQFERVLWSVPKDQQDVLPQYIRDSKNIRLEAFTPQRAVLQHGKVSVFFTHAGASSSHEALYFSAPDYRKKGLALLCMGFFGDQPLLSERVQNAGAGIALNKETVTAEEMALALKEIIENPKYAQAAQKIGRIFQLDGGGKRAGDLIMRTLVTGTTHMALPHTKRSYIIERDWDIFLVQVFLIFVLPYFVLLLLYKCCCCCCFRRRSKNTTATNPVSISQTKKKQ